MEFKAKLLFGLRHGSKKKKTNLGGRSSILKASNCYIWSATRRNTLIYLLFINDIHYDLECTLRLFADDTLLYHTINDHHDALALQRDFAKLGQWAEYWQMDFNHSKCYKMYVHRKKLIRWNSHEVRIIKKASFVSFWFR